MGCGLVMQIRFCLESLPRGYGLVRRIRFD